MKSEIVAELVERDVGGRPEHQPTAESRKYVEEMSAYGIPQENIARVIGITHVTLRKHYRQELDTATDIAVHKVARSLFEKATGDGAQAITAAIFFLKTRAGWKDTMNVEITGKGGGPMVTAALSQEDAAKAYLDAIAGGPGMAKMIEQKPEGEDGE